MKKVAGYFGFSLLIMLIILAVLSFLANYFGWRVDAVMSGSMESEIKVGSLIITRPVQPEEIKVGDIISFYCPLSNEMISHRVISVASGTLSYFRTKGDANEDPDPFIVPARNIAGRVWFNVPYLGYVTQFIKTRLGILLTLCIPGLIIIALEIRNIWRVITEDKTERKYRIG